MLQKLHSTDRPEGSIEKASHGEGATKGCGAIRYDAVAKNDFPLPSWEGIKGRGRERRTSKEVSGTSLPI
jgi:hypothetical protein